MKQVIALFGEAEKGAFKTFHRLGFLPQLLEQLGEPPKESEGLHFAVQALLYNREILYFRVPEEGFSRVDYFKGIKLLEEKGKEERLYALCLPGVGDKEILMATEPLCKLHTSLLITTQKDLYDFLTS